MSSLIEMIDRHKLLIKSDAFILFRRPWLLLSLPAVILRVIYNRWQRTETTVYLLEMKDLPVAGCKEVNDGGFAAIHSYDDFEKLAGDRLEEDPSVGWYYLMQCKKRFAAGDHVVVYEEGGCVKAFSFIAVAKAYLTPIDKWIDLPPSTIGMYDVYTFRNFRREGAYKRLFNHIICWARTEKYKKVWLWLMKENQVSIRVHHSLGLKRVIASFCAVQGYGIRRITVREMNIDSLELL